MKLMGARVLITGGTGGIGQALARELMTRGAQVLLTARHVDALDEARNDLQGFQADGVDVFAADLTQEADRAALCAHARQWRGGIDVLINNAGVGQFSLFEDLVSQDIERGVVLNVLAPLWLCHELLPHLRRRPKASILNMGSVFGFIGYPAQTTYCAAKFALRGFTEALRRELDDTHVSVHYLAPRSTRTAFNPEAIEHLNRELHVAMDSPEAVARAACAMLAADRAEAVVGWPEKLFARLNALVPRLVDGALRRQLPVIRRHVRANVLPLQGESPHEIPVDPPAHGSRAVDGVTDHAGLRRSSGV